MRIIQHFCVGLASACLAGNTVVSAESIPSNYKRFQACVETTMKGGLIRVESAKRVCGEKYAKDQFGSTEVFVISEDCTECKYFKAAIMNDSSDKVLTKITVAIKDGDRYRWAYPMRDTWIEPGRTIGVEFHVDREPLPKELSGKTWEIYEARGLQIRDD